MASGARYRRVLATLSSLAVLAATTLALPARPADAANGAPDAYVLRGTGAAVIDTGTRTLSGSVTTSGLNEIAFSPDGARAYAVSTATDAIVVIDTATRAVVATHPTHDAPLDVAVTPDGARLVVTSTAGPVQVLDAATGTEVGSIAGGGNGQVAVSPDGARAYVASGPVIELDLDTLSVSATISVGTTVGATRIVLTPDGDTAYFTASDLFGSTVGVLDLSTRTVVAWPGFGSLAGSMAIAPNGSRLYVGVQATWVDTGYGAGFFPGRTVRVLNTATNTWAGHIDLGASGSNWSQQNTASGIAVTPDNGAVYIGVPRTATVAIADTATNAVSTLVPMSGPGVIGIAPDPDGGVVVSPIDAVDDVANATSTGRANLLDVLANDRFAGAPAVPAEVSLEVLPGGSAALSVSATGSLSVAPGAAPGVHSVDYRICETAAPTNCDGATVTVTVRAAYPIDAVPDTMSGLAARAVGNVLANDTLNGVAATTATTRLTQVSSTASTINLVPSNGSIFVLAGTPGGSYTLQYRLCETADPANCDEATVAVTVVPNTVDAVDDTGTTTRSGGTAVANVLANDKVNTSTATTGLVNLTHVSSTHAAVTLNPTTGAVTVAAAAPIGTHTLTYRICEKLVASNCDTATVVVTVTPYAIDAVNDSGRGASKYANTVIANVLANDRFAGATATLAKVAIKQLSSTNAYVKVKPKTGEVVVTRATSSGIHTLTYRICERGLATNCDVATVTVDLSGGL